ncbi:MAG: LPS export ABC transporter permease LptF [Kangiellaceae bacterium]|nr:LPS export ABC transporter permease LptF [Kangiellaceae bacterium]
MILKNYINKDIYRTTAAILLVLILIFVSSRFVKYIQLAVDGTISANAVFSLLALQIPSVAGFLIPLSFFLAILLTFGRLYSDNELVVVHGLGIGQQDLAKMLLPSAFVLALAAGALSTILTPWALTQSSVLMAEQAAQAKLGVFSAGRFKENSTRDGIVFVESKTDSGEITGVFSVSRQLEQESSQNNILQLPADSLSILNNRYGQVKIQTARSGRHWENEETGVNYLVLENGQFSEFNEIENRWQLTHFDSSYTKIVQDDSIKVSDSAKSASTLNLIAKLGNRQWAELHWRLAAPISIPLICLLAIPLSRTQPRKGKFSRLLPSVLIYLIYVLLMMYSRKMVDSGRIPGEIGFWWIHLGLGLFVYWLYLPLKKIKKSIRQHRVGAN